MGKACATVIPPYRASSKILPEIRLFSDFKSEVRVNIIKNKEVLKSFKYIISDAGGEIKDFLDFSGVKGSVRLDFCFYDEAGELIEKKHSNYEIIDSQCNSTTLIDGCWISIYHWSEDEARWFNKDLKKLSDGDWKDQIYAMNRAGINGVIIQNVFHSEEYAGKHHMTLNDYTGQAFYPSELYKKCHLLAAQDPVEAILYAADEVKMNVFMGVGLFAWFDFSKESLEWHKEITKELFKMYGHHPSLYAWYISEEIFGSLYYDYPPVEDSKYMDIVRFFKEYKSFAQCLTPTIPVALAPNNIRFHEYENEWKEILCNIDILLPFAFARDPENMNIDEISEICKACGTHFWVDMEMFAWPLDNGLVPKTVEDLIKEIRVYDKLEQIYGYQYTGIMNAPECHFDLGGEKAKKLYKEYLEYYKQIKG